MPTEKIEAQVAIWTKQLADMIAAGFGPKTIARVKHKRDLWASRLAEEL